MTTIRTKMHVYSGRTVETIVRREYGRTAFVRWSADRNSPELGQIVKPVDARRRRPDTFITRRFGHDSYLVLDTLLDITQEGQ